MKNTLHRFISKMTALTSSLSPGRAKTDRLVTHSSTTRPPPYETMNILMVGLCAALAVFSCKSNTFVGESGKSVPGGDNTIVLEGTADKTLEQPFSIKPGPVTIEFTPGMSKGGQEKTVKRGLHIYFAIDVTGSMQPVIDAIKNAIVKFSDKLVEKDFSLMIGAVAFRDDVVATLPLTSTVSQFQDFISKQVAGGGDDANEAALLAVSKAIEAFARDSDTDAVKAILVVTDNPGHMGGASTGAARNCSVEQLLDKLNGFSADEQAQYKIYASVMGTGAATGFGQVQPCSGFDTAKDQWQAVLSKGLEKVSESERGGELPWPFTESVLMDDFIALIDKTVPGKDQVCVAEEADLLEGTTSLGHWTDVNFSNTYTLQSQGKRCVWKDVLSSEKAATLDGVKLELDVVRCCVAREDATASKFDACDKLPKQKITFQMHKS